MKKAKAIVLFSGGLDSILAVKLLQEQKIEVIGIHFTSPMFCKPIVNEAKQLKIKIVEIDLCSETQIKEFISMIRKPRFGYGSAINPCVDCHLLMLRKAKQLMEKLKADFVATGEVLDERPMSQTREKLGLIELESGLHGKLLRPLSAKLLPETIPEQKKLVDRNKLLGIHGRQRIMQLELAKKWNLVYPAPGGGCLFCEKEFAIKMRDLLRYKQDITKKDLELLKIGRHFRVGESKIIVGRNENENKKILELAEDEWLFEPKNIPGPVVLLERATEKTIKLSAGLAVLFSDAKQEKKIEVNYRHGKLNKSIIISPLKQKEAEKYRIR